jgi:hypothetical protein
MKEMRSYHDADLGWLAYKDCSAAALPEILGKIKLNI